MKISVPIMLGALEEYDREKLIKKLHQLDAEELIICFMKGDHDMFSDFYGGLELLKENISFFESRGIKTAVWIETLAFYMKPEYVHLTTIDGRALQWICPIGENFLSDFCAFVKEVAKSGVKKIVLEDDFRMQITANPSACFCDNHMKLYRERLGEDVTREKMREMVFSKGMNKYRRVWMDANRETLNTLAKRIRSAVDEINPKMEFRLCAGPTLFGGDGSNIFDLVDILKGEKGKCELRLIGGPYWLDAKSISAPMDFERMQMLECKKRGVTAVVEDDVCPRQRHVISSYRLEFYHTVAIADGNFDGVQKYAFNYVSDFDYDNGYVEKSEQNKELYREIERVFKNKTCRGLHLVDAPDFIEHAKELPLAVEKRVMYSSGRKFLSDLSLPAVFEPGSVNVIFGENARCIDKKWLKNGSILDLKSALVLQEMGVDVGIDFVKSLDEETPRIFNGTIEDYFDYGNKIGINGGTVPYCNVSLSKNAKQRSSIRVMNKDMVGSYTYENANGERFLVYGFEMDRVINVNGTIRNFNRQKQVVDLYEWLSGGDKLPAVCVGNPDLYLMTKVGDGAMAIGLWNNFEDEMMQKTIKLHKPYKKARFIGCDGMLLGDEIILAKALGAYSYGFIELTE